MQQALSDGFSFRFQIDLEPDGEEGGTDGSGSNIPPFPPPPPGPEGVDYRLKGEKGDRGFRVSPSKFIGNLFRVLLTF